METKKKKLHIQRNSGKTINCNWVKTICCYRISLINSILLETWTLETYRLEYVAALEIVWIADDICSSRWFLHNCRRHVVVVVVVILFCCSCLQFYFSRSLSYFTGQCKSKFFIFVFVGFFLLLLLFAGRFFFIFNFLFFFADCDRL